MMGLRQTAVVLGTVFAVALAIVIGKQMSTEAMAVIIGVVCGVAAGIPTSFLLFVVLMRRERLRDEEVGRHPLRGQGGYPPVVVIQGGAPQPQMPMMPNGIWPSASPGPLVQRQFNLVGGEDMIVSDERY